MTTSEPYYKTYYSDIHWPADLVLGHYRSFKTPAPARKIRLGFIPLTDCAPLVAAKELGLFAKYGVDVELSKKLPGPISAIKY